MFADLQPSLEPCLIPAEMPLLLSASVIHRMQAALIPKQSPYTSPYTTDRQHHDDSFWMKHIWCGCAQALQYIDTIYKATSHVILQQAHDSATQVAKQLPAVQVPF